MQLPFLDENIQNEPTVESSSLKIDLQTADMSLGDIVSTSFECLD